jgi:toxin HigB-1
MRPANFRHNGLRQLHEDEQAKGVPAAMADKLRKLLFALETAESLDQVGRFPGWKPLRPGNQHRHRYRFDRLPLGDTQCP